MNDPRVVQASDAYVRIIIRRPHAYFFLGEVFKEFGGVKTGTPTGCVLGDGSTAPLPGLYVLHSSGGFEAQAALRGGSDGVGDLLELMKAK